MLLVLLTNKVKGEMGAETLAQSQAWCGLFTASILPFSPSQHWVPSSSCLTSYSHIKSTTAKVSRVQEFLTLWVVTVSMMVQ